MTDDDMNVLIRRATGRGAPPADDPQPDAQADPEGPGDVSRAIHEAFRARARSRRTLGLGRSSTPEGDGEA